MKVLGIETSCDETAAAVVQDGCEVLSNIVYSQIELHRPYGGVVPEIASRNHVSALPGVIARATEEAGLTWGDIDGIAVTYGPGLSSSLVVGMSAAKALALRLDIPLIGINHLEAHIHSAFLDDAPLLDAICPFVALLVSGGHTCLYAVEKPGSYRLLGETLDDAAGEAFDKAATLLGLEYPGGPSIEKAASTGDCAFVDFPRSLRMRGSSGDKDIARRFCFSFSGLKTSLLYYLRDLGHSPTDIERSDIAASYQEAIVDSLAEKAIAASKDVQNLVVVGGVAMNGRLRARLLKASDARGTAVLFPKPQYCTDNAAMVAGLAHIAGIRCSGDMILDAMPNLRLAAMP
jgi:N6-L-threonylcarbamoyladenine synthase